MGGGVGVDAGQGPRARAAAQSDGRFARAVQDAAGKCFRPVDLETRRAGGCRHVVGDDTAAIDGGHLCPIDSVQVERAARHVEDVVEVNLPATSVAQFDSRARQHIVDLTDIGKACSHTGGAGQDHGSLVDG